MVRLKDICDVDWGDTNLTKQAYVENGKYLGVSAGGCDGRMDYYDFEAYTPVISAIGANCGKMFLPEEPFVAIKNTITLKPHKDILGKYIFYALNSNKIPHRGGGQPFISKTDTEEYMIICPSLEEQTRIVTIFDKVCKTIDMRHKQLSKLDEIVKSRFIELFGDPESNPYGHPIKKLSDIASYWNGLTYKPEDVQNQGTIVLRSSNIQNSQLDFEDTVRVACRIREKQYVQNNDILMCSRNGSAKLVGKVALITNIAEPMSFGAFMMIIRSDYYRYLMTYFQMDAFRNQIKTGATTTINQITGNMLNQVTLPVPDLSIVSQFATFVEQTDKSKLAIQKSLEKLETLKKSLMQKYFE